MLQVFDRFLQADNTSTRSHGGLGLGLEIVRQLIEMHGSSIQVASLGKGATFTVNFPLETGEKHPPPPTIDNQHPPLTLEGLRILVVDDEADRRDYEVTVLELFGAKAVAVNCAAALEVLQTQPLDILLSYIGMPGENGYSLIQKVRNLSLQIPAIALTAYAREEDCDSAISSGFQMHLTKPVEPTQLVAAIASLVQYPTIDQHPTTSHH